MSALPKPEKPAPVTVTMPGAILSGMLTTLVSEISEQCYCASWMSGIEEALQRLVPLAIETGEPQAYGQGEITSDQAIAISAMVDALGGWERAWDTEPAF